MIRIIIEFNKINNLNYTNSINLSGFQNYETGKNIKNQDIINNNIINNNKNPFQNVISPLFKMINFYIKGSFI